jgi:molybdenum transport protein
MIFIPDSEIERLIGEDLQFMDATTLSSGIGKKPGRIECYPKRPCVVAGVEEAARIFSKLGGEVKVLYPTGSRLSGGEVCLTVDASVEVLHAGWKVSQNIMEHSSGIATRAARMVKNAREVNPNAKVAVTRKSFPGSKLLCLKAAFAGGATVHRLGLSDSILVFEQHRAFMKDDGISFAERIDMMKSLFPEKLVEVEVETPDEGFGFLKAGADVIQCERFDPAVLADFAREVKERYPYAKVTAAGGINADNAAEFAKAVDVLVTSWVFFGKPEDIKVEMSPA